MIDPQEQIRAILSHDTWHWALKRLPDGTTIDDIRFRDLISVDQEDVLAYVRVHGFPESVVAEGDRARVANERLCIEEIPDGQWAVYYSERGGRMDETRLGSHDEARAHVVDRLFDSARIMLNHRWWHAHPAERPPRITDMP